MSTAPAVSPLFTWKDEYGVGVATVDAQHKELIQMISQLHQAMMQGKAKDVLSGILDKLVRYTETHFADEEKIMLQRGYPRLSGHVAEHRRLTTLAHKLRADFLEGRISITIETLNFLKNWLNDHILGMDQQYARFFAQQGRK